MKAPRTIGQAYADEYYKNRPIEKFIFSALGVILPILMLYLFYLGSCR
jgi:hypothetical protein